MDDDLLEQIAQEVERLDFGDLAGILAKRKRQREDAEVRRLARVEQRAQIAEQIRSMKTFRRNDALAVLERIATETAEMDRHDILVMQAWPLAWKGWLNIFASIQCNSNCIPPTMSYRIELTEAGRAALASARRERS